MAQQEKTEKTSPLLNPVFASKFPKAAAEVKQTSPRSLSPPPLPHDLSGAGAKDIAGLAGASAVSGWMNYAAPAKVDHVAVLREAVAVEDWGKAFSEGRALCHAKASWCASAERCSILQSLCVIHGARRVLEIGSFCGAAALALAEALPSDGTVVSLEFDPFFVEFGERYRSKSLVGSKIKTLTGPAIDNLAKVAEEIKEGKRDLFDYVIIDADKSNMQAYFNFLMESKMLTERPLIVVDATAFKGQIPMRYQKFGMADKVAPVDSGEQQIIAFSKAISESPEFVAHEFGGAIVITRSSAA